MDIGIAVVWDLRLFGLVVSDILEESAASIFRVAKFYPED
jgi:hypothetical protein